MDEARNSALNKHGDLSKAVDDPPPWIKKEFWVKLLKEWQSPEFLKRSVVAEKNRSSNSSITYTNGSQPYEVLERKLRKEQGLPVSIAEVSKVAHKKSDDTWSDDRAKGIYEGYEAKKDAHTTTSSEPFDPTLDIWKETIGGVKKGILVGFGPKQKFSKKSDDSCGSQFSHLTCGSAVEMLKLKKKTTRLEEDLKKKDKLLKVQGSFLHMLCKQVGLDILKELAFTVGGDDGSADGEDDSCEGGKDDDDIAHLESNFEERL